MKAIQLVFKYLPVAYANGNDANARMHMHNASTMAGMAFTNAFLGINHSLAHKLGGQFNISHGRANAIMLPHVIAYNGSKPSKFVSFPNYEHYIAHIKYQEIAKNLGLPAATPEDGVQSLINAVLGLMHQVHMPTTLADCGIKPEEFATVVMDLAEKAFEDQCTTSNPRMPLISELVELYRQAYGQPLISNRQ
jgi:acetaldehyde dehydrogenase/alcohol dehydrogenase